MLHDIKHIFLGSLGGAVAIFIYNFLERLQKEEKAADKADESGWVSSDERFPDCSDYYLVMLSDGRILGLSRDVAILYYRKECNVWSYESDYGNKETDVSDEYVIAWQPLPDIYRGWQ